MQESVVLITSKHLDNRNFGSGFIVHQDNAAAYIVTCAHVIKDVGGGENVFVDGKPSTIVALGEEDGFDLAVLRAEGLQDRPSLNLCGAAEQAISFSIIGFSLFDKIHVIRRLTGTLGEQVGIESKRRRQRSTAWDLKIQGENYLQRGYSGSPVVHQLEGYVLGIVSHLQGQGEKGLAISVETLEKIWKDMPSSLVEAGSDYVCSRERSTFLVPNFADFWGRNKELEVLTKEFQSSRIILINGEPGVGKTYIAAQFAQGINRHFKVLWIDKRNLKLDEVLFYINEILKEDGHYGFMTTHAEESLEARDKISTLLDVVNSISSPKYAFFIDNFQLANQSELMLFIERFSTYGGANKLVLISSLAISLGLSLSKKIKSIQITGFRNREAVEYVTKCSQDYGLKWTNENIDQVIERTAGHPIAINLIIQRCSVGASLDEVLEHLLEHAKKFGDELYQKLLADIANYLTSEEERAMHRLAVFRTPVKRLSWRFLEIREEVGEVLLQRRLLTLVDSESFQMHPLIQQFWWQSIQSEEEEFFAHEKAAYYYWEQAKKSFEASSTNRQEKLDFDAYSEAEYHFNANAQRELSEQVIEEFICATHKHERLLLSLPSLTTWLPELDETLIAGKPWLLLELAKKLEKDNTESSRKKAEVLFSRSYDAFTKQGDSFGSSIALYYKGKILHLNNQVETALRVLRLVLEIAEGIGDVPMQIRTLAKLISCYTDLHRYDEASLAADKAELLARSAGDRLGQALILYRKGSIERHRSNFEDAEGYFVDSAEAFEALGDKYRVSKSLSRLGIAQDRLGKYQDAISNLNRAINIKESLGDEYGLALDTDYLGDVYRSQGLHEKAKNCYQKSLNIKEKRKDSYGIVKAYNNLARNALLSGFLDEVNDFLERSKNALEGMKQRNEKYRGLEGAFLTIQGDFQFKAKRYQEAIESYIAAQGCFVAPQHSYARVSLSLGRVYLESKDFGQARAFLSEALELFKGNSTRYHEALTLNYLAKLEALYLNLQAAETNYLIAFDIASEIGAKDLLLSCEETKTLIEILQHSINDSSIFSSVENSDKHRQAIISTHRARILVFSDQVKEAKYENDFAIKLAAELEANEEILIACNETKGLIEEGQVLENFQDEVIERVTKAKEKLINKVWSEFDKVLQEFIIKQSVSDIARLQIRKNLWRLVVKLLFSEAPILTEEDYSSIASLETSFSRDMIEEAIYQEVLNVKYTLLTSGVTGSTPVKWRAKYLLLVLAPISGRLSLDIDLSEIEQLAFKVLNPSDFKEITDFLNNKFRNQEDFALKVKQEIEKRLHESRILAEVFYRNKTPYSIYRKKTERKGVTFEKILDFVAFRIITKTVDDCYRALVVVDSMGTRFRGKGILAEPLRDYIKSPKLSTGYQSIHVNIEIPTCLELYGEPDSHVVEFQIRTRAMHADAESGGSAHSYYKDISRYSKPNSAKDFRGSQQGIKVLIECEKSLIGEVGRVIRSKHFDILSVDINKTVDEKILLRMELRSRNQGESSTHGNSSLLSLINSLESLPSANNEKI